MHQITDTNLRRRDIKAGSNGAFQGGPGYELVSGIGVPKCEGVDQRFDSLENLLVPLVRGGGACRCRDPMN